VLPQATRTDPVAAIDEGIRSELRRWSPSIMRWTLALVFVWFGALKVFNVTPVAEVAATLPPIRATIRR
jgi:hypothetical protein